MELKENSYIGQDKPTYEAIRINAPHKKYTQERQGGSLKYYRAHPIGMKVRLFFFWSLWAVFLLVLAISVLVYYCVIPQMCTSSAKHARGNDTAM